AAQRGKRSLSIDLKTDEGREIFYKLVAEVDIVHHNFRPGVAERLGVGYEQLVRLNPRLIYGAAPGYGNRGPKSHLPSFAPLQSAFVGIFYQVSGEGNSPVRMIGSEDYFNSMLGAIGILMALYDRNRTGKGQYIDGPQLNSSLFANSELVIGAHGELL